MFYSWKTGQRSRCSQLILLLVLGLSGCQKKVTGPPPRYVVLRFENLSGDPSLEWVGRAASEFLSRSLAAAMDGPVLNSSAISRLAPTLGQRPANVPGISTGQAAALLAGATRTITGYIERSGGALRIEAVETDLASGKSTRSLSATAAVPLQALTDLAHKFSPTAQPYLTDKPDALKLYIEGYEGSGDQAVADLERSLQADANFGPSWVLLVNADMARGNRDAAQDLISKAARQRLGQFDQANLDLASALLRNDQSDRLIALRQITALSPGDTVLLRSTAEEDERAGDFEHSAAEWNQLAAVLPNDANAWNQLGYTRAWGGDYPGALAAMKEYARLRPNDPNPLDSTGDIHFLFRKYTEAAAAYLEANSKDPAFQNGGDFYKAAWAKFEAGDKTGADAAFAQFRAMRQKSKSPKTPLFEADWLYRTGRKRQAISLLRTQTDQDSKSQIAIWELLDGDRAAGAKDAAAAGPPASVASFLARFASMPSASPDEWKRRAESVLASPSVAPLRSLAVGYALLLDDKDDDALPVWKGIVEKAAGTDFTTRAIYTRLQGDEPKLALLPDPNGVNQFAAVLDSL